MDDSQVNVLASAIENSGISLTSLDELAEALRDIRGALDRIHTTLERIADQGDSA